MLRAGPRTETILGAVVIVIGAALLAWVYGTGGPANRGVGYELTAVFDRADGLRGKAQVRLAGLPVGTVIGQDLDENFRAVVTMRIDPGVQLPADTAAVIRTDGLLGDKHIELEPGGDFDMLRPGDTITYTQSAVVVEELLARILSMARARHGGVEADDLLDLDDLPGLDGNGGADVNPGAIPGTFDLMGDGP